MTLLHRLAHLLGWNGSYIDHYRDIEGHLRVAHFCSTCRTPNRASSVHSHACDCAAPSVSTEEPQQ